MRTTFKDVEVTDNDVVEALQEFDNRYPNFEDYEYWRKYAIRRAGRLYPPKYILELATAISRDRFNGGEPTNKVFQKLGFTIIHKQQNSFLLTWNPNKYIWHDFQQQWEAVQVGHRVEERWSCGNSKKLQIGDRVFLMVLGQQKFHGIIASGVVTQGSFEDVTWNPESSRHTSRYVMFEYDALLHPEYYDLFNPHIINDTYNWTPQTSGLIITDNVAEQLNQHWREYLDALTVSPINIDEPSHNTFANYAAKS